MAKIVLVSGSIRRDSHNTAVLETVRRLVGERPDAASHEISWLSVGLLPFYDAEIEQQDSSVAVREAKALVEQADAVFISTPSYNGEMSGALKNALDWLSRPGGSCPLTGKTVAVTSASPGARGALDAQPTLTAVLGRCGAELVAHEPVAVGRAGALRAEAGGTACFTDPDVLAALDSLVRAVFATLDARNEAGSDALVGA
ncbi:NADPH-dependent FMN reductase [Streptacidiphilus rugosus]|uniref:NADPH-dependent FMN reductase n=1 Tax=Streptacidiphilus rugosus TaxID=405783 RepID=UPI00068A0198|nr:NADPH-dependent FMN reductase [Streptacidiphilus rugosus]